MKGLTPVQTSVTLRFASGLMRARHTRLSLVMAVVMVALALLLPLALLAGESDAPMTDQLSALFAEMLSDTNGQLAPVPQVKAVRGGICGLGALSDQ
ncbi:hypothetical protein [Arhodomonas sp. SL1]|uniref:hypothetical protein n=1 Tax=Arhodomonas sp. SL1 TaxID=3425691 RepID=UPI003F885919